MNPFFLHYYGGRKYTADIINCSFDLCSSKRTFFHQNLMAFVGWSKMSRVAKADNAKVRERERSFGGLKKQGLSNASAAFKTGPPPLAVPFLRIPSPGKQTRDNVNSRSHGGTCCLLEQQGNEPMIQI
jgi:hypothetical protein